MVSDPKKRWGSEMKSLTEKAIQEEALVRASMSAVQDLEKAGGSGTLLFDWDWIGTGLGSFLVDLLVLAPLCQLYHFKLNLGRAFKCVCGCSQHCTQTPFFRSSFGPRGSWKLKRLAGAIPFVFGISVLRSDRSYSEMGHLKILSLGLAVMLGDASEIAILPNAKLASRPKFWRQWKPSRTAWFKFWNGATVIRNCMKLYETVAFHASICPFRLISCIWKGQVPSFPISEVWGHGRKRTTSWSSK